MQKTTAQDQLEENLKSTPKRSLFGLAIAIGLVATSQLGFLLNAGQLSKSYGRQATGIDYENARHFYYFYHHLGHFPLTTTIEDKADSQEAAQQVLESSPDTLLMERDHWVRQGEYARIWAFVPDMLFRGKIAEPSVQSFNVVVFGVALISLLLAFWKIQRFTIGCLLVALLATSPYLTFEIYRNGNLFGLPIVLGSICLAINLRLIDGRDLTIRSIWRPAISGTVIAILSQMRNETMPIILSCAAVCWLAGSLRWKIRLLFASVLLGCFFTGKAVVFNHFESKWAETETMVATVGGHVYNGPRIGGHPVWHPIFCGLGDFDRKKGYLWNDLWAFEWGTQQIKANSGTELQYDPSKFHLDEYYDEAKKYYVMHAELPEYNDAIKAKLLADISSDPIWYFTIVAKRIIRQLVYTTPIGIDRYSLNLRYLGLAIPLLFGGLLFRRQWFEVKLLLWYTPLAASSIVVYSGGNNTFNSPFHFVAIAIVVSWLVSKSKLGSS